MLVYMEGRVTAEKDSAGQGSLINTGPNRGLQIWPFLCNCFSSLKCAFAEGICTSPSPPSTRLRERGRLAC